MDNKTSAAEMWLVGGKNRRILRMTGDDRKVGAILETKPYVRKQDLHGIQKQEGAQMAAWIYQNPDDSLAGSGKEARNFS